MCKDLGAGEKEIRGLGYWTWSIALLLGLHNFWIPNDLILLDTNNEAISVRMVDTRKCIVVMHFSNDRRPFSEQFKWAAVGLLWIIIMDRVCRKFLFRLRFGLN